MTSEYSAQVTLLVTEFLTTAKEFLVNYLAEHNRNATGKSSASIQVTNVTPNGGQLIGADHIEFVFTGRGPGGMPPISKIIDWLNARGLPRSIAWAVARHIADYGTKLFREGGRNNNALLEALSEEKINAFTNSISRLVAIDIDSQISGIFNGNDTGYDTQTYNYDAVFENV